MHARPQIREILIAKKLRRWLLIAKYPFMDRSCFPQTSAKELLAFVPAVSGDHYPPRPQRDIGLPALTRPPPNGKRLFRAYSVLGKREGRSGHGMPWCWLFA